MKMKLREASERLNGLTEVENLSLPVKLSYAISYNTEKLLQVGNRLEKERLRICEKMAAKGADGKAILEDGKYQFATPEDEEEVELRMCSMDELYKCEEDKRFTVLTAKNIQALSFMIEEE